MNIAELSTIVVWGATTAYALAFGAFAWDLARRAEVTTLRRAAREPVAVGSAGGGSVADPAGIVPEPDDATYRPGRALGIAMSVTTLGMVLQLAGVVLRGLAAGRVPWANMYEFTVGGTFVAVEVVPRAVPAPGRALPRHVRASGLGVVASAWGSRRSTSPPARVEPALQSYWIVIHVTIAVIASGTVHGRRRDQRAAAAARLVGERAAAARPPPVHRARPAAERRALEGLAFRLNAVGFVLWTFTVMAGAVWAEHAWSRFWGWDPKEVWSFVVWLVYAAYLHARTTRGWSLPAVAWFSIAGFSVLIFNFTIVNLFLRASTRTRASTSATADARSSPGERAPRLARRPAARARDGRVRGPPVARRRRR